MKTTIRRTIVLFVAALALAGCSKDDEPCDPNNEESPCYAGPSGGKLLLVEEKQSDFTYKYTYDERNRMIRWDQTVSDGSGYWTYTYDGSDRLIGIDIRDEQGTITAQYTYSYGNGDRPVSGTFGPPNSENALQIRFAYAQSTITETHITTDDIVGNVITYSYDSKGNLVLMQNQSPNESSNFLFEYGDYDDNPYPIQKSPSTNVPASVNNFQSYKSTTVNGVQDHRYEYTYNHAGYPIQADIYDLQTGVQVATREYTYKEAN